MTSFLLLVDRLLLVDDRTQKCVYRYIYIRRWIYKWVVGMVKKRSQKNRPILLDISHAFSSSFIPSVCLPSIGIARQVFSFPNPPSGALFFPSIIIHDRVTQQTICHPTVDDDAKREKKELFFIYLYIHFFSLLNVYLQLDEFSKRTFHQCGIYSTSGLNNE